MLWGNLPVLSHYVHTLILPVPQLLEQVDNLVLGW
jgi:hypothetical protein